MGERKQPGRFTLQFNMNDPQQQETAEILERQGRRKAQFITSAVMQYTQSQRCVLPSEEQMAEIVHKILNSTLEEPSHEKAIPAETALAVTENALSAIANTLTSFRHA